MTTAELKDPTRREETFIRVYDDTGNASEAYRQGYSVKNMNPNTVRRAAHKVLHRDHVQATLQAKKAEREQDQRELQELAREHTEAALGVLVSVMNDDQAPASARVQASTSLIDRGWGKPVSKTEVDANINHGRRTVEEMSDEQLFAVIRGGSAAH